ncbi:HAD family hydrolase [Vagococcus fluvialis]|uniref:HAD family hydrolase n=1 Tax=Vagococcus fluvialis TaxID=2738 RepID=UPI001A8EBFBB|nr:HAD family hydrolase [Vagococcus fluvialis]MBO0428078.1 HAD family hydrolase [Vagococcus fluvialis]
MKTIIFDVDDTLYDQVIPFKKAIEKNFPNNNIDIDKLYEMSRRFSDEVFELTERGEMNLENMHIYRIQEAFKYFGTTISQEEARTFQKDYQNNQKEITLLPDIQDSFDFVSKQHITMGIVTNGPIEHQKNKIKQLGLEKWIQKSNMFISSEVGIAKPDVRLFELVQKKMNLVPSETYYIGDSFENDVVGASNAGWNTIWINRKNKKNSNKDVNPNFIVNEQNDIISVLKVIL